MQRMTIEEQIAFLTERKADSGSQIECLDLRAKDGKWEVMHMPTDAFNFVHYSYRIRPKLKTIWVNEYAPGARWVAHESAKEAAASASSITIRTAVRYIEWPEGYELRRIGE